MGKRSSLSTIKMRINLWLVLSPFGCLCREPAAARDSSSSMPGTGQSYLFQLFVLLVSLWIISAEIRTVTSSGRLYYKWELIYF